MDIIPLINKNGLWMLDKPDLLDPNILYTNQLIIVERYSVELLDTLAKGKQEDMTLEFHYSYINPYDAKLIKFGHLYKCESIFYNEKETILHLPPYLFKAMVSNPNPDVIYIRVKID